MSDFRVLSAKEEYSIHPIGSPSADIYGLNMRTKEAAAVAVSDRLSFFYEGRNVTFGNKLLESEGEAVKGLITSFSGRTLREDEEMAKWKGMLQ